MALGRGPEERQEEFWVAWRDVPRSAGHPFYQRLQQFLRKADFDAFVEDLCEPYYAEGGRRSIPPGRYFRMLFVGYFEGIDSQRGIAWRCSDSLSLREFLGLGPTEAVPDHSSLTRIRQRLPESVHEQVFVYILEIASRKNLLRGNSVAVDSTTLEANAAMKSIVRKDTGEDWKQYLRRLAEEAGIENPTDEDLRRFDKDRNKKGDKKVSNDQWQSPADPDSRIAKMKDGRTHLAYKAEHVVDLESEFVLAATVYTADQADSQTLIPSVIQAQDHLDEADGKRDIHNAVTDKGYYSTENLVALGRDHHIRAYIPEPKFKGHRCWTDQPAEYRRAAYANRKRTRGKRGRRLGRLRSERVERSFAHVCDTGGARRTWLRGLVNVSKRYLIQVAARNLGLLVRKLFGMGKPRCLQGLCGLLCAVHLALIDLRKRFAASGALAWCPHPIHRQMVERRVTNPSCGGIVSFSTGC